ncbi:MAG: nucleotide exchange factor GrpE [Christensenellaceae bacterium]|jgi:molecular chaperone GrpE|nr:nucleotide exchange factor GrpE [Christensenellaceae bacterium]
MSRKKDKTEETVEKINDSDTGNDAKDQSVATETVAEVASEPKVEPDAKDAMYLEQIQRLQAEFSNYVKRNKGGLSQAKIDGSSEAILSFLPVKDAIERALSIITDTASLEGVALIRKQFDSVLTKYDVTEFGEVGDQFDPHFHNAIMRERSNENSGKVIEVLQKGYSRYDKVIRYAMVKVAE